MAAVSGKSLTDSQELWAGLDEVLAGGPCFMTGSVENLPDLDSKGLDISCELELFSARISELRDKVLALQQKRANPNPDLQAMKQELGEHVQALRRLQGRIIEITGKVNQDANQAALGDASLRIAELFPTCLACLYSIEPPPTSSWSLVRLVQSFFAPKPNAVEELRRAFPVLA